MSAESIEVDEGFWRLLLGSQFDNLEPTDRTIEKLVDKFYQGRKPFIDTKYGTKEGLIETIREESKVEAQRILLTIWAEEKWERKSSGDKFEFESDFQNELTRLQEEGLYVEQLSEGFTLAWPSEEVRLTLFEDDGVRSQVFEEAHPLFLKRQENTVEVRGSKTRVNRFSKNFTKSDNVKKVERESARESIIEGLSTIFTEDIGSMELIEIEFRDSNLPDGSAVTFENSDGVRNDLNSDVVKPRVVDFDNLSALDYLKFKHSKSGKAITINVQREESGFFFEIQDSYLTELEKENIKDIIEEKLDISFTSIYPYDVQHDEEYVLHQILSGNIEAYKRYYEDLTETNKQFLAEYINISENKIFECVSCQEEHEEEIPDICEECGNQSFNERTEERVEINEDAIYSRSLELFEDLDSTITVDENTTLTNVSVSEHETKYNDYIRISFNLNRSAGKSGASHNYEFFIYCLGNGRIPRRVKRYLLDSVLITYGKSRINGRDDFGTIDFYKLNNLDDEEYLIEDLFAEAVIHSRSKLTHRVFDQASKAKIRLNDLQKKVDQGQLEDLSDDEKSDLKNEYDSDDFERDVFYLLKTMFLFAERWGRPGETETDGCLIIPQGNGYFVSGYDPKLTYDPKGYNLRADEKKKAAYYILSESKHDYIRNVLKDNGVVDGHILISDIFREGQFGPVADHVQEWFRITNSGEGDRIDVPVIFLKLENLLKIYRIFEYNYEQIEEYTDVKNAFRDEFVSQALDANADGYTELDDGAVERIRERVIEERGKTSRQHQIRSHADDS